MRSLAVLMGASLVLVAPLGVVPAAALPLAGADALAPRAAASPLTRVEYFCSPGFVPSYGGQCVATLARDEVEIYVNEPVEGVVVASPPHRHHHRHALHERY